LPIINHVLDRMNVEEILRSCLPREDGRTKISCSRGLMLLVRNILISREPLYGIGEWARRHAPDLLGLTPEQMPALNDDRSGRWLTRFFASDPPAVAMAVTTHTVREFQVSLDEFHNDSTSVTLHGAYVGADRERLRHGRWTPAITFGHNKDHRPDLKQLLYVLTLARDGGVPVQFRACSGNVLDDQTHRETWDLLCELAGRPDFLYVADCKLATVENMTYIHGHGGRFVTVLPRTRKEDDEFRGQLAAGRVTWRPLWEKENPHGLVVDRFSVSDAPTLTAEGYRLVWYYSTRKSELDAAARATAIRRGLLQLGELRGKLHSPRTRYRDPAKVHEAITEILEQHGLSGLIRVVVEETPIEKFRQNHRGRPGPNTHYIKHVRRRFDLQYEIDHEQLGTAERLDGVFPLVTNDRQLSELELLHAYKRQPLIEKRFEQMKTDFAIAPVWLKDVERVDALMGVYYLALLAEALLERELRRAMERAGLESLPMYPEGRPCRCPTARRLIDLFDPIQRHEIRQRGQEPVMTITELTPLQRRLLRLLGIPVSSYGQ
jgi:transposase